MGDDEKIKVYLVCPFKKVKCAYRKGELCVAQKFVCPAQINLRIIEY